MEEGVCLRTVCSSSSLLAEAIFDVQACLRLYIILLLSPNMHSPCAMSDPSYSAPNHSQEARD